MRAPQSPQVQVEFRDWNEVEAAAVHYFLFLFAAKWMEIIKSDGNEISFKTIELANVGAARMHLKKYIREIHKELDAYNIIKLALKGLPTYLRI